MRVFWEEYQMGFENTARVPTVVDAAWYMGQMAFGAPVRAKIDAGTGLTGGGSNPGGNNFASVV